MGSRIRAGRPSSLLSLYLAGALPRLGFEPMAQDVQEANGDLVRRASTLEPQVTLPQLSDRHPQRAGWPRATAASSVPLEASTEQEATGQRCVLPGSDPSPCVGAAGMAPITEVEAALQNKCVHKGLEM